MPMLTTQGEGKPSDPAPPFKSAIPAFAAAQWTDWQEAHLKQVIQYIRGNTHLDAPPEWRAVFPRAI